MSWYEWVFSGVGLSGLNLWKRLKKEPQSALEAKAAKVTGSPVASGSDITQNVTEHHYYFGHDTEHTAKPPAVVRANPSIAADGPTHNFALCYSETIAIVRQPGEVFRQWRRDNGIPAIVLKFSNDGVRGRKIAPVSVKATVIYRLGTTELVRVIGEWLDIGSGHPRFDVDSSHKLLVAFVSHATLYTLGKEETHAHRRTFWRSEHHELPDNSKINVLVRITGLKNGYCFYEGEFEVRKEPLGISAISAA